LYLTLVVSLSFCCPWELFASWSVPGFTWHVPPAAPERAYDWLLFPFLAAASARDFTYLWCLVIAVPLLFFLPTLILFVVFMPALQLLNEVTHRIAALARDDRTVWEQFVDRLSHSRDPVESAHLFAGFFHDSGAPALVDPAILSDHAYIVGQTGSGKTAL